MRFRNWVWSGILAVLVTGCSLKKPDYSFNPTPYASATHVSSSVSPTNQAVATIAPIPSSEPAALNTLPYKQTLLLTTTIQQQEFLELSAIPTDWTYHGTIIFAGKVIYPNNSVDFYRDAVNLYDLKTGQTQLISQYKIIDIVVSPDRRKYALRDRNDDQIKVFSSSGQILATILPEIYPWSLSQWLDNEQLVLSVNQPLAGTDYIVYPRDIVVVNPFVNNYRRLVSDYPDIDQANNRTMWEGGYTTVYDSTLSRVVYAASIDEDYSGHHGLGYVLLNMDNQEKLAQIVTGNFSATPKWSPDGSKFIVSEWWDEGLFYLVTRDGKITRIVNSDADAASKETYRYPSFYSWSPDGRYIAFWLEALDKDNAGHAILTIMNTITGETTDTGILAGHVEAGLFDAYVPVWSPDGKNVVTIANRKENGTFDTVLVDLERRVVMKIDESLSPIGWLDTESK